MTEIQKNVLAAVHRYSETLKELVCAAIFITPFAIGTGLGLNAEVAYPLLVRALVIITIVLFASTLIQGILPETYSSYVGSLGMLVVAVGCLVLMSALLTMGLSQIWDDSYKLPSFHTVRPST